MERKGVKQIKSGVFGHLCYPHTREFDLEFCPRFLTFDFDRQGNGAI